LVNKRISRNQEGVKLTLFFLVLFLRLKLYADTKYGLGILSWSLLAHGVLLGIHFMRTGLTPDQLGVLWCKDKLGVTAPLIGPQKMEHLENLILVVEMTMDDSLREACDNLVPPGSAVANSHNTSGQKFLLGNP